MKVAKKAAVLLGSFLPLTLWAACAHPPGAGGAPSGKAEVDLAKMLATAPSAVELPPASELPRATLSTQLVFCGGPTPCGTVQGYNAKIGMHQDFADHRTGTRNAVTVGAQWDRHDPPGIFGVPLLHANIFTTTDVGCGAGFMSAYALAQMPPGKTYQLELRYYHQRKMAYAILDGKAQPMYMMPDGPWMDGIPIQMDGRLVFQTEVNGALNGDYIEAQYSNLRIGGTIPEGNGYSTQVLPDGPWNDWSYNFWGLKMVNQQPNRNQGITIKAMGALAGLPPGLDWHTIELANDGFYAGQPAGALSMVSEYWHGAPGQ